MKRFIILLFAFTNQLYPMQLSEQSPNKETFPIMDLPLEIRIKHVVPEIRGSNLQEAFKIQKAFLLTTKQHAAWLKVESLTKSRLFALQKNYKYSLLEIATFINSPIAQEIANKARQVSEESWQKYISVPAKKRKCLSYGEFVLPNKNVNKTDDMPRYESSLIPSLLFYNYTQANQRAAAEANHPYIEDALITSSLSCLNRISDREIPETIKLWLQSGIFLHKNYFEYTLGDLINQNNTITPAQLACMHILIHAGYDLNRLVKSFLYINKKNDNMITITDWTIDNIRHLEAAHPALCAMGSNYGAKNKQQIAYRKQILHMLTQAGARPSFFNK